MNDKNLPQEPGFYWAAVGDNSFNTIVEVAGSAPFFTVEGYSFQTKETVNDIDDIRYFGSRIDGGEE